MTATSHLLSLQYSRWFEDASAGLWRMDAGGRIAEIDRHAVKAGPAAMIGATANLTLAYFEIRDALAPFDEMRFVVCPGCQGKKYVEPVLVVYEHSAEGSTVVGRFRGTDMDDVRELGPRQSVGWGAWDCDDDEDGFGCIDGLRLEATGRQFSLATLREMCAVREAA